MILQKLEDIYMETGWLLSCPCFQSTAELEIIQSNHVVALTGAYNGGSEFNSFPSGQLLGLALVSLFET